MALCTFTASAFLALQPFILQTWQQRSIPAVIRFLQSDADLTYLEMQEPCHLILLQFSLVDFWSVAAVIFHMPST